MSPESNARIWEQASKLVQRYGDAAPRHAAERAHALLDAGAPDRWQAWLRTRAAAEALLMPI